MNAIEELFSKFQGNAPDSLVLEKINALIKDSLSNGWDPNHVLKDGSTLSTQSKINRDKVTAYMWKNMGEVTSLDQLAALVFQSKFHFLRCFKDMTGYAPLKFFRGLRVFRARHILSISASSSCLRLADVALDCGFSDQPHFSRTFKKLTGMTPTAYLCKIRPKTEF